MFSQKFGIQFQECSFFGPRDICVATLILSESTLATGETGETETDRQIQRQSEHRIIPYFDGDYNNLLVSVQQVQV